MRMATLLALSVSNWSSEMDTSLLQSCPITHPGGLDLRHCSSYLPSCSPEPLNEEEPGSPGGQHVYLLVLQHNKRVQN